MKRIFQKLMMVAAIGSLGVLYSCNSDDEEEVLPAAPSLNISASVVDGGSLSDGGSVTAGDTVQFSVSITAEGGFNVLRVVQGGSTQEINRNDLGLDEGATSVSGLNLTIGTTEAMVGSSLTYRFEAVDDNNQIDTASFTFSVASPPAKVQTAIIFAAPLGDGSSNTFYSVSENTLYSHNDVIGTSDPVSANIDLGYYFGQADEATIVSPSAYPSSVFDISAWGTRNQTGMADIQLSTEDFNALTTVADVQAVLDANSDVDGFEGLSGLEVGTVAIFETAGGQVGLFIVRSLDTGFNGQIELEFILAEAGE
jgi:hypothetical protein